MNDHSGDRVRVRTPTPTRTRREPPTPAPAAEPSAGLPGPARWMGLVALVGLGLLASAIAVRSTGAADPLVFVEDAGPLVRWSAPLVRVLHDLAASATLGALVTTLFVVRAPVLRLLAGVGAQVWAVTGLVGVVLTFSDAAGLPLSSAGFVDALLANAWDLEPTRIGLVSTAIAAVISLAALALPHPSRTTLAALLALAVVAAAALGLASHTGTSADHETSVNAMAVHITAAGTWVGGLLALAALRRPAGPTLTPALVRRWSTIALWCFCAVALSGLLAATTRLGPWSDLGTPYGRLLVVKAVGLVALGAAGWAHRRFTIRRLETSGLGFWRLVLGELAVMAVTIGVATALARSAPPVPEEALDPSPALALTGYPPPPAPDTWSWVTTWRVDWLLLALAVVAIAAYAAGLVSLRRAGRGWPASRTAAWVGGWLVLVVATSGGAGTYGRVSLSWHVALVVVELLVVPALLVPAEPAALATLVARPRADDTVGLLELARGIRGSTLARLLANPLVAVGVTVLVLIMLVLGPGLGWTLETHPGHLIVSLALPLVGGALVASVRSAHRAGERTQVLAAVAALAAAVALLGLALVLGTRPLALEFFGILRLPWLTDLLADQRRSGWVAWGAGALGLAGLLANLATTRRARPR